MKPPLPSEQPGNARRWQLSALNAAASLFLLFSFALSGIATVTPEGCTRQIIDFHVFWSAAGLALEGTPLAVFDHEVLRARFNSCDEGWLPWLHPAPALALMTPFGLLPLIPAWFAFNAFSLAALGLALRPFTNGISPVWLAVLLAPALLPALLAGQFATLWLAGLLAALAALRADRAILAGVFIGCLTLKPTLGLLIPVALLAIGAWRTIAAAAMATLVLQGGATLLYGAEYWLRLLDTYGAHGVNAIADLGAVSTMTSLAAALARFGVPTDLAVQINLLAGAALAVCVFLVWKRHGRPTDAAAALLCAAIPLATPYLWHYDSAFLVLTALFLLRLLSFAPRPAMAALIALLWVGAGLSIWLVATTLTTALPQILTVPPLLLLAFAAALAHSVAIPKEGH